MMHDPKLADFLLIVLIAVLIWVILWLVGRSRDGKGSAPAGNADRQDGDDRSRP